MKKLISAALVMMAVSCSAMATEAVQPKELHFCTGAEGGFYDGFGRQIGNDAKKMAKGLVTMDYEITEGSVSSASMFKAGDCDIAILQADAVTSRPMPSDIAISDAHLEAIYWLVGKNGVKDFEDLAGDKYKNMGIAIVNGSGAEVTLRNFGIVDKKFKDLNIIGFDDWFSAAKAAAEGKIRRAGNDIQIAGLIYVGRPGNVSTEITGEFKEDLKIGTVDVSSFKDVKDSMNNPMYTKCSVGDTNGLKATGGFFSGSPETYCVRAQIVYNNAIFEGMDSKQAREIRKALDKSIVQNVRMQQGAKK